MVQKNAPSKTIATIQKQLSHKNLSAILITDPINIQYLSNFTGSNGQVLITPKTNYLITDFRYLAVAKKILPSNIQLIEAKKGLAESIKELLPKIKSQLGFEESNLSYQKYNFLQKKLKPIKLVPIQNIVETFRIIKNDHELKLIKKAQQITEAVFLEVRKSLTQGVTENFIADQIKLLAKKFGADDISFPPIVGFNENSASPHHQNGEKKLKKGDIILIDMGMKYQGYCSDMTRMIFTATPNPLQTKIYNTVLAAQTKVIQNLKAGITGHTADTWARDIIIKAGYGKTFGHSLGHGIGLEVHEAPTLSQNYDYPIPEGTIVTVEPGIYLEDSFGVRIEDMVLVKRDKVINLTKLPKEISACIFPIS